MRGTEPLRAKGGPAGGRDWCHLEQVGSPLYNLSWDLALKGNI